MKQSTLDTEQYAVLFDQWREGAPSAGNQLFSLLQQELSQIARLLLQKSERTPSLSTGDLVNEALVRLFKNRNLTPSDRAHLLALSARAMRYVLIDRLRAKTRDKRHGQHIALSSDGGELSSLSVDLLALDHALRRLSAVDPKRAELVEMRFFAGMTIDDIALAQGVSPATVKRLWTSTRLWLQEALTNAL